MKVALVALEKGERGTAQDLLELYIPLPGEEDFRSLYWRFLWSQLQDDDLYTFPQKSGVVEDIAVSADGRFLTAASFDDEVRIWDLERRMLRQSLKGGFAGLRVRTIAFSPDPSRNLFAAVKNSGKVPVWETVDWKLIQELDAPEAMKAPLFAPDGKTLVIAFWNQVRLWDATTWESRSIPFSGRPEMTTLAFAPGESVLAIGNRSTVQLWDYLGSQHLGEIKTEAGRLAFSPEGNLLVSAGLSENISILGF